MTYAITVKRVLTNNQASPVYTFPEYSKAADMLKDIARSSAGIGDKVETHRLFGAVLWKVCVNTKLRDGSYSPDTTIYEIVAQGR